MSIKKKWIFFVAPPGVVLFIALGGEVVQQLWNVLLPELFGWRHITFWQALGLLTLCRILFGGLGCAGSHQPKSKRVMDERWDKMTPEEREKFRQGLRSSCGGIGAPPSETQEPA
jgi:hypothetical protein